MEIVKISAIGIVTAFCVLILRENKSEIAILLGLAGSLIILISLLDYVINIFSMMSNLIQKAGVSSDLITTVFKILGIGFITEFSSDIIEESGSKSLAQKVVFAGKIVIFYLSMPVIVSIFNVILEFAS